MKAYNRRMQCQGQSCAINQLEEPVIEEPIGVLYERFTCADCFQLADVLVHSLSLVFRDGYPSICASFQLMVGRLAGWAMWVDK